MWFLKFIVSKEDNYEGFTEPTKVMLSNHENGTGKTHIMKVLYSACQASRKDISFSQKTVGIFKPDGSNINRR
jgi:ABC-type uncharacterized transport system ATPase subunit